MDEFEKLLERIGLHIVRFHSTCNGNCSKGYCDDNETCKFGYRLGMDVNKNISYPIINDIGERLIRISEEGNKKDIYATVIELDKGLAELSGAYETLEERGITPDLKVKVKIPKNMRDYYTKESIDSKLV